MSKRKAPEPPISGKAAGKRRAEPEAEADPDDSLLGDLLAEPGEGAELTDVVDNAEALADAIGDGVGDADDDDDDQGDEDDLLAAALGEDDDDDDAGGEPAEPEGPALPEAGELPDGVTEEKLQGEVVDLTACGVLTIPQARRVAQSLASNDSLTTVKVGSSTLAVGDLKEDAELEWDSEDYTDVEAIIIAELLKANTTVERLDLARNQISDAGVCALALMLGENSTIEYLNLESNTFAERGAAPILEALSKNSSLQYLNLMYNSVPVGTQDAIRQAWQASSRDIGLHL